jgi:hypothetical protein
MPTFPEKNFLEWLFSSPISPFTTCSGYLGFPSSRTSVAPATRNLHRGSVLNLLRIAVGKAQRFFKGGKDHPLDAIAYVAAALIFAGAGALRLAGVIG